MSSQSRRGWSNANESSKPWRYSLSPRILIYDLETSYLILKTFQLRNDQTIPFDNIIQERNILTAAWKWLGEKKTSSIAINPKKPTDDHHIVKKLSDLFQEADAVVAHYGSGFDNKYLNTRAIFHGLPPIKPAHEIDTWQIARKKFLFNSNRLDYLGKFLGLGRKIRTDSSLWHGCMSGNRKAISEMSKYNRQDVDLLEAVYKRLAPFVPPKVNASLYSDKPACPNCGSKDIQRRGLNVARSTVSQRLQCRSCGAWSSVPMKGGTIK